MKTKLARPRAATGLSGKLVTPEQEPSRKRVFLHIGFHKTGTTALQDALIKNTDQLHEAGIMFPSGLSNWPSHPELAWALAGNIFPWQDKHYAIADVTQYYRDLIDRASQNTILLSSEELCRLNYYPGTVDALSEMFAPYDTRIIGYARAPREFLASRYRHEVQQGSEAQSFADFLAHPDNLDSARFDRRMITWATVFPGKVQLRYYQRSQLVGGNIVTDFLGGIGMPSVELKDDYQDTEVQMHPALTPFMSLVNRTQMPEDIKKSIFTQVLDLSCKFPRTQANLLYDEMEISRSTLKMLDKLDAETRAMVTRLAAEYKDTSVSTTSSQ